MARMSARSRRGVMAALAATAVTLGGLAATAAPAAAATLSCVTSAGHYETAGSSITAYKFWSCSNGDEIPLPVSIDQYQSPGVWNEVASGSGFATYYCNGFGLNEYRASSVNTFAVRCG